LGGTEAVNASPVSAIADQFGSEVFGYTNRAASQNAIVGWTKLAENNPNIVEFPKGIPQSDFLNRFLGAKVTKTGKFNDTAAQLREQQDVIKRRLLSKTDPSSTLMKVGFYSKFGFLNPDQFLLQSLHALTIAAVSPIQGMKAQLNV